MGMIPHEMIEGENEDKCYCCPEPRADCRTVNPVVNLPRDRVVVICLGPYVVWNPEQINARNQDAQDINRGTHIGFTSHRSE